MISQSLIIYTLFPIEQSLSNVGDATNEMEQLTDIIDQQTKAVVWEQTDIDQDGKSNVGRRDGK